MIKFDKRDALAENLRKNGNQAIDFLNANVENLKETSELTDWERKTLETNIQLAISNIKSEFNRQYLNARVFGFTSCPSTLYYDEVPGDLENAAIDFAVEAILLEQADKGE